MHQKRPRCGLSVHEWRDDIRNVGYPPCAEGEQALRVWATHALEDQSDVAHICKILGSAALFSLGEVRYAADILDLYKIENPTEDSHQWRCVVFMLPDLLPLPREVDPSRFANHEAIKNWLIENQTRLRWNETVGKYVFMDQVSEDKPTGRKEGVAFFSRIWKKLAGHRR